MATDPRVQLADRYEILDELRHDEHSVTYLARHKTLNRDVSVTVLRSANPNERNVLGLIAADARILGAVRHDHIVPVLDTRWLSADELAIVRPRVRGTTVRTLVTSGGPLNAKRTEELLREIGSSLEWASRNGVVHRYVSPDSVCVQQGSKKVLISFGPPAVLEEEKGGDPGSSYPGSPRLLRHCSDANTLAVLGWTMLTGHEPTGSEGSMRHLRPDIPPPMAEAIDEGLRCDGQAGIMPLASFMSRLGGSGSSPRAAGIAVPVAATTGAQILPGRPAPVVAPEPISHRGSGLKVAMVVLVVVALALGAWVVAQKSGILERTAAGERDTGQVEAGDVTVAPSPAGPSVLTTGEGRVQQQVGVGVSPAIPAPVTPAPGAAAPPAPINDPVPPAASGGDPCESPTAADQRRCLDARIAANDRGLNATYSALVRTLSERDPAAAAALRDRQRSWLVERDNACRGAGSGDYWAVERAQCLGAQSAARERELAAELSRLQ